MFKRNQRIVSSAHAHFRESKPRAALMRASSLRGRSPSQLILLFLPFKCNAGHCVTFLVNGFLFLGFGATACSSPSGPHRRRWRSEKRYIDPQQSPSQVFPRLDYCQCLRRRASVCGCCGKRAPGGSTWCVSGSIEMAVFRRCL